MVKNRFYSSLRKLEQSSGNKESVRKGGKDFPENGLPTIPPSASLQESDVGKGDGKCQIIPIDDSPIQLDEGRAFSLDFAKKDLESAELVESVSFYLNLGPAQGDSPENSFREQEIMRGMIYDEWQFDSMIGVSSQFHPEFTSSAAQTSRLRDPCTSTGGFWRAAPTNA
jgi:hypothetical protein